MPRRSCHRTKDLRSAISATFAPGQSFEVFLSLPSVAPPTRRRLDPPNARPARRLVASPGPGRCALPRALKRSWRRWPASTSVRCVKTSGASQDVTPRVRRRSNAGECLVDGQPRGMRAIQESVARNPRGTIQAFEVAVQAACSAPGAIGRPITRVNRSAQAFEGHRPIGELGARRHRPQALVVPDAGRWAVRWPIHSAGQRVPRAHRVASGS